jgi:L-lactate dehydrogenase
VHAVALDSKRILPVSSLVSGTYGMRDVCISVPTVVGCQGIESQLEIELWPKEVSALQHSAQVLRETIDQVQKGKLQAAGKPAAKAPATVDKPAASRPVRVTMGAGGSGNVSGARSRVTISGLGQGSSNGRGGR